MKFRRYLLGYYVMWWAVLVALYFTLPGLRAETWGLIGLSGVGGIVAGVVINRPTRKLPWLLLAAALASFTAGQVSFLVAQLVGVPLPFPSFADVLYLLTYPLYTAGLLIFIWWRTPDRDRRSLIDALTLIAPRHPERGRAVGDLAKTAGLSVAQRSLGEPPKSDVDIFVADTLGELGLIYRLAPIVFMGGSLASHGGQNPIEPIRLGAAVVHGPHVWNFAEIYEALDTARGAQAIADEETLTTCLSAWLTDPTSRTAVADAAMVTVKTLSGALERTLAALEPYLMQLRLEQRAS